MSTTNPVIKAVIEQANQRTGSYSEKQVFDAFSTRVLGNWPDTNGSVTANIAGSGDSITLVIADGKVECRGHDVSTAGRIWLINNIMGSLRTQATQIFHETAELAEEKDWMLTDPEWFARKVFARQASNSYFIKGKGGKHVISFSSRTRSCQDGSIIQTFDISNIDVEDGSSALIVFLPGGAPQFRVYLEQEGSVVVFNGKLGYIAPDQRSDAEVVTRILHAVSKEMEKNPKAFTPAPRQAIQASFFITSALGLS